MKISVRKRPFRQVRDRTLQKVDHDDYAKGDASPEIQERLGASDYPLEEVAGSQVSTQMAASDLQGERQRLLLQRLQRQRVLRRQQGQAQAQGDELGEVVDAKGGAVFCFVDGLLTLLLTMNLHVFFEIADFVGRMIITFLT